MKVSALAVDPLTGLPMVILVDEIRGTSIPVGIGLSEASAIAAELDAIDLERPMTHQLLFDLLSAAGAEVVRIELRDAERGGSTPCAAQVALELGGRRIEKQARPSDAFALALKAGARVWVDTALIDKMVRRSGSWASADGALPPIEHESAAVCASGSGDLSLDALGPEAFGKWKMCRPRAACRAA